MACVGTMALTIPVAVFAASLFMAVVGFADDLKSIPVLTRLLLQALAVGAIIFTAPGEIRIVPPCPIWIERGLLLLAGLWFVNLVNFMDGLDWMTVAEVVPITGAMVDPRIAWRVSAAGNHRRRGTLRRDAGLCAVQPSGGEDLSRRRRQPADRLAAGLVPAATGHHQQFAAALLLPLYYLLDATTTLLRRLVNREPFWAAHRSHFYQRATDNGFTVSRVVGEVFALNIGLAALAAGSIMAPSVATKLACLAIGAIATASLLRRFARPRT